MQGLWKDRLVQDSYGLVHARLGYRLRLGPSVLTLSGEVRNVFDTRIAEIFNAPLPGRWWIVGLAWGR
ncbi:MAG: TonB-dependent receptor [Bacteroidetes bacterium]|nr:MAG: TonB-dependent receptor [Bacteroidota bacterium]